MGVTPNSRAVLKRFECLVALSELSSRNLFLNNLFTPRGPRVTISLDTHSAGLSSSANAEAAIPNLHVLRIGSLLLSRGLNISRLHFLRRESQLIKNKLNGIAVLITSASKIELNFTGRGKRPSVAHKSFKTIKSVLVNIKARDKT
jgi:hypothetical protein